ncbi:transcriptional regulator [Kocuria atrinae]|uniref:winged helix-turn-helix domain-containing protein n=1 Tax=Kocuria atrinae TaxID=592377 RepID=UPI0003036241|nr:transcriptional regulator [Kocuria atrinae]
MNFAEARESLNDVIHSPVRLSLVAALNSVDSADYQTLREVLGVSYSLMSKHAGILEDSGYLVITKEFARRTPVTRMSLTRDGRAAFSEYLEALDRLMRGLT